jgi:putative FmdB family regulatory protein
MPTYQYTCSKCGDDLEVYQSFTDPPLKRHQGCGGSLQKVFAPVGIVLKGSGFYKTDSRSGSRSKSERTEKPEKSDKTETKADASSSSSSGSSGDSARADSPAGTNGSKKDGAGNGSAKKSGKGAKPATQST